MSEAPLSSKKQLPFVGLLLISFGLFNLGYIVDQTIRWSDHVHGLMNGALHVMIFGIAWCLLFLPWSLLIFALYRWRKWQRYRTHWVLTPAILALIASLVALIVDPPTPSNRFKRLAKCELPDPVQNLHYHFMGGGIADYNDTYYFETSSKEIDRLIAEMDLKEDVYRISPPIAALPDCPDSSSWPGRHLFRNDDHRWSYYLVTNKERTKVYVWISCI